MNRKYQWAAVGDINAFFGLMLDNVAGLILIVSLLHGAFGFPVEFALRYMVPGTAIGVFIGDMAFFVLAFILARRTGHHAVTAMPLGLDTPSTFGMVFLVLGPAYSSALPQVKDALTGSATPDAAAMQAAAMFAWQIGICSMVTSGVIKLICAFGSNWLRQAIPRAGLLGSLGGIALVLISFLPLLEIFHSPVIGLVAMAIILTSLVGKAPLPFKVPGTVAGLVVAGIMLVIMRSTGILAESAESAFNPATGLWPTEWQEALTFSWVNRYYDSLNYLPIVIPFAIATIIGGIDCTESASAAGDHYNTNTVIAIEAVATLLAGFCGAVVQTTPYIGHPAYKAMGGRAAYALATAITMGLLGTTGLFGYFYEYVPKAAVFPILVFVGLEIGAQSFLATPKRHYPAVAMACIPCVAKLLVLQGATNEVILWLANGFILTSVIWSSALAMCIDRKLKVAGYYYLTAAALTFFGLMHSPKPEEKILLPFSTSFLPESMSLEAEFTPVVWSWIWGYVVAALLLIAWHYFLQFSGQLEPEIDHSLVDDSDSVEGSAV